MIQEFKLVVDIPSNGFDRVIQSLIDSRGRMTEEQAATLVNLSPSWFSSAFKRNTGMKYRECQLWARLSIAAVWLTSMPWLRVSQVADELGYSDSIKFGIAFKRRYGISPTAFRKTFMEAKETLTQSILSNGSRYILPQPTCDRVVAVRRTG